MEGDSTCGWVVLNCGGLKYLLPGPLQKNKSLLVLASAMNPGAWTVGQHTEWVRDGPVIISGADLSSEDTE